MSWFQMTRAGLKKLQMAVASLILAAPLPTALTAQDPPSWHSLFSKEQYLGADDQRLNYRLMKPEMQPGKKYPLVIFLHGAGERGDNNQAQLVHGLKDFASEDNRKAYPCWVIAPQCPRDQKWANLAWNAKEITLPEEPAPVMNLVMQLLDQTLAENDLIDQSRIYITGLSMGGFGTIDAVARWPERFAAAAAVCGGGDSRAKVVAKMSKLPWWIAHGKDDAVVPFELSEKLVAALKSAGADVTFVEMDKVGHDSWTKTYNDPEFMKWLFSKKK